MAQVNVHVENVTKEVFMKYVEQFDTTQSKLFTAFVDGLDRELVFFENGLLKIGENGINPVKMASNVDDRQNGLLAKIVELERENKALFEENAKLREDSEKVVVENFSEKEKGDVDLSYLYKIAEKRQITPQSVLDRALKMYR